MEKFVKTGYLFDGTGKEPEANMIIAIEEEKITLVGTDVVIPDGAEVIDWSDKYVMPGMIDTHLHIGMPGASSFEMSLIKDLVPYKALIGMNLAQKDLHAGFTALRDCGEAGYIGISVRNAINEGLFEGPRMQTAGCVISMTGGHADSHFIPEVITGFGAGIGHVADGVDQVRKAARTNLKYGADFIKLAATGGVLSSGTTPGSPQLNYDELKSAIDEAAKLGKGSASHAQGTVGIKNAIRAGVKSIDHGFWLDDESIEMMLERGTFMVPTLVAGDLIIKHGVKAGIPEYAVRKSIAAREDHIASMMKAYKAGVNIAMGTDAGTPFNGHGGNAKELELMVDAGISTVDVLRSTTSKAAELMGWEDKIGSVTVGKFADMVALPRCPVADIKATQEVCHVMKGGTVIR